MSTLGSRFRAVVAVLLGGAWTTASACSTEQTVVAPEMSLQRMQRQPRYNPFGPSRFFSDGRAMRSPPTGTVSRGRTVGPRQLTRGVVDGRYDARVPVPVTRALLEQGRDRFETVCASCHGVLGDGDSPVAAHMQLRRPPSLHEPRISGYPPGRIYEVITEGYGVMPAQEPYLTVEERWAVVAYVHALELSQRAPVAALPDALREALAREAP